MQISYRILISVVAAVLCALLPASVTTRAQSAPHWQVGDVFVGVGSDMTPSGKYVVYDQSGNYKETLRDTTGTYVITTGCMIAPVVTNAADNLALGEALYGTNFYGAAWSNPLAPPRESSFGPTVTRISADEPHAATIATTITQPNVIASESIVFDASGNYYVGGIVGPFDGTQYGFAYIFKYSPTGVLLNTYEVPNGNVGADWIDLGSDGKLYYTSEDAAIHWYDPASATAGTYAITYQRVPFGTTAFAMRVLPPLPNGTHGGFLVATRDEVLRLRLEDAPTPADPTRKVAEIAQHFDVDTGPNPAGTFFALNIAPDGKSFWTATEQPDMEYEKVDRTTGYPIPLAPARAHVYKFDLATGALLLGPIDVTDVVSEAFSVKGLCLKREYTAAFNQCVTVDGQGNETVTTCTAVEICSLAGDNDGDTLLDEVDPDCTPPGTPQFIIPLLPGSATQRIPDVTNYVGDTVTAHPSSSGPIALSAAGNVTFSATGLPLGLGIDETTGIMSGTVDLYAPTGPHAVTVIAANGSKSTSTRFTWTILGKPINHPPTLSAAMATSSTHPSTPFTVSARRLQEIRLKVSDQTLDSLIVAAGWRHVGETAYTPGLPPGYILGNSGLDPYDYQPSAPPGYTPVSYPDGTKKVGLVLWPYTDVFLTTDPATGYPTVEGAYEVLVAVTDTPQNSYWGISTPEQHDFSRPEQHQTFAVTVVNSPPVLAPVDQKSIVGKFASYTIVATDADGHTLTYGISGVPAGLTVSGNVISGVPTTEADYNVTVTVTDETGAAVEKTFVWRVRKNTPPSCGEARPTQVLWPPNHKLVPIGITGVTDEDEGDTISISITNIYQDEPVEVIGSGATNVDGMIDGATAWVRAERTGVKAGPGDGRVYKILFSATDGKETCTGVVTVGVPHDMGQMKMPVENGTWWNSISRLPVIFP